MAVARVCDRCRNFFIPEKQTIKQLVLQKYNIDTCNVSVSQGRNFYDLCEKCATDLINFLHIE